MGAIPYTEAELQWIRETLGRNPRTASISAICADMSQKLGRRISPSNLGSRLGAPPTSFLGRAVAPMPPPPPSEPAFRKPEPVSVGEPPPPAPPPDPVERHAKKLETDRLRSEHKELLERLREAEGRQSLLDRLSEPFTPKILRREKTSGLREATAFILASDWHIGEWVNPHAVAGRNEFNTEVSERRVEQFFRSAHSLLSFARSGWLIRDVVLWLGGDLVSGQIHEELEESNELSAVEACVWLRPRLTAGINSLLADTQTEQLTVSCSFGNHGRTTKKRRSKTGARNSYEWMLYQFLAGDYENEKRVVWDAGDVAHQYVDVYDRTVHLTHGDTVRFAGGVGGLSVPLNKRVPKWDNVRRSALNVIGHFHQLRDLQHTIVNGTLRGYSEHDMDEGYDFEEPQQGFFLLDSKKWKCGLLPLWLDGVDGPGIAKTNRSARARAA